ncbi:hypothetical protein P4O66_005240, partial [Electrophorus voltai]
MFSGEPLPYEPFFRGPVSKRSCTDIICCMTFVAAIVSYMRIGSLAWLLGDPRHVLLARNSTGMFCGSGVNFDKPNVLYFDVLKCTRATTEMDGTLEGLQCPTTQVCVKKCPSEFWKLPPEAYAPDALPKDFFQQQYCDPRLDLAQTTLVKPHTANEQCNQLYRWQINPHHPLDRTESVISEVFAICNPLFQVSTTVTVEYNHYRHSKLTLGDITYNSEFSVYLQVKETWLFFLVSLCLLEFVILLFLTHRGRRISVALALIKESNRAVSCVTTTLAYPLVTFLLVVICVSYWGITSLYLATSGAPVYHVAALNSSIANCSSITGSEICIPKEFSASLHPDCPSVRCVFFKYDDTDLFSRIAPYLQIYNLLAFLWCVSFIIALGQCTLAGTFASFYWAFSKPADIPPYPLLQAFIRTLGYIALAFHPCILLALWHWVILTMLQIPRIVLENLDYRFRDSPFTIWLTPHPISTSLCQMYTQRYSAEDLWIVNVPDGSKRD